MSDTSKTHGDSNVAFRQVGKPLTRIDAPGQALGKTPHPGHYAMPDTPHATLQASNAKRVPALLDDFAEVVTEVGHRRTSDRSTEYAALE